MADVRRAQINALIELLRTKQSAWREALDNVSDLIDRLVRLPGGDGPFNDEVKILSQKFKEVALAGGAGAGQLGSCKFGNPQRCIETTFAECHALAGSFKPGEECPAAGAVGSSSAQPSQGT
jgi:hypothetical protein